MIGRVLAFEWGKWRARRESWWTVGFLLVATIGYGALTWFLQESALTPTIPGINSGDGGGYYLAFQTTRTLYRLLGVFLLLWGAASLVREYETGTLRLPLLKLPRRAFPMGKGLFLTVVGTAVAAGVLGLAYAMGAASYGLSGMYAGRVELHSSGQLFAAGVFAALLSLLPMVSTLALGIWASCVTGSVAAAQSLALMTGTVLWAGGLAPGVGSYLFPATMGWPFAVAISKAEGLRTMSFGSGVGQHVLVNVVWITLLLGMATWRFGRRDLR